MNWQIKKQIKFKNYRKKISFFIIGAITFLSALFVVLIKQHSTKDVSVAAVEAASVSISLNSPDASTDLVATTDSITAGSTISYRWIFDGTPLSTIIIPGDNGFNDFSVNDLSLTNSGVSFTTTGCQVGGCLNFVSSESDYITVSDNDALDIGTSDFTFTAWIKLATTTDDWYFIYDKGQGTTNEGRYRFAVSNTDHLDCLIYDQVIGQFDNVQSTGTIDDTNWHFVSCVMDRDGNRTYYIDTNSETTDISSAASYNLSSSTDGIIGARWETTDHYFNGLIDEFNLFNRALSSQEITQIYNDGFANLGGPTEIVAEEHANAETWDLSVFEINSSGVSQGLTIVGGSTIGVTLPELSAGNISINDPTEIQNLTATLNPDLATSEVGYQWTIDATPFQVLNIPFNAGNTQTDISGSGNNGTIVNEPWYTSSGKVAGGLAFDGVDDYLDFGDDADLELDFPFTISTWIKLDSLPVASAGIFTKWLTTGDQREFIFYINSGNQKFTFLTSSDGTASFPLNIGSTEVLDSGDLNVWKHAVVVADSQGVTRIYIDGALDKSGTASSTTIFHGTASAQVSSYNSGANVALDGTIDELQIYDRALSTAQVATLYSDGNSSKGGPTVISSLDHQATEAWRLDVFELAKAGSIGSEINIDTTAAISAVPATSVTVTDFGSTQVSTAQLSYSCSTSDNGNRDMLLQYSIDGGSTFYGATISAVSSGTAYARHIQGVTCDGTTQTVTWDASTDLGTGISEPDAQLKLTPLNASATPDTTTNFTVVAPSNVTFNVDTTINDGDSTYDNDNITVDGATLTVNGTHSFHNVTLTNNATLTQTVSPSSASAMTQTHLNLTGDLSVESGSLIDMNSKGFAANRTYNGGAGSTSYTGNGAGGSHGGYGGRGALSEPISTYGDLDQPVLPGAGGRSDGSTGTNGGGAIRITCVDLTLNGTLRASGGTNGSASGKGAGGSIWVASTGTVTIGANAIQANGGDYTASTSGEGGGGGGRIAFYHNGQTIDTTKFEAYGGTDSDFTDSHQGSAGTIYIEDTSTGNKTIIVDNDLTSVPSNTPITSSDHSTDSQTDLIIRNEGILELGEGTWDFDDVTLTNNALLTQIASTSGTLRAIYLNLAGNLTVGASASINVTSKGLPANYTYSGGISSYTGYARGGSHGGYGGNGDQSTSIDTYGSMTAPVLPGAGGRDGATTGRVGGGAIRITAVDFTLNGSLKADGQTSNFAGGYGAGGSIYVTTTGTVTIGSNNITANGGDFSASTTNIGGGGGGRIAFYHNGQTIDTTKFEAYGGNTFTASEQGSAGTIYIEDTSNSDKTLIIDNDLASAVLETPISFTADTIKDFIIRNEGRVIASDIQITGNLSLEDNAYLTHDASTNSVINSLNIDVEGNITMEASSEIDGVGIGVPADRTISSAGAITKTGGVTNASDDGGSHGGIGNGPTAPSSYGSLTQPTYPGAGGDDYAGGGAVKVVTAGDFLLNGLIDVSASSAATVGGRGAGGSIWLDISGTISGTGTLRADGGDSLTSSGYSSGGGGRIAIYHSNQDTALTSWTITAYGGAGINDSENGAPGTIYYSNNPIDLVVDNGSETTPDVTPLCVDGGATSYSFRNVSVNRGTLDISSPCNCPGTALTVTGYTHLENGGSINNIACQSLTALNITTTSLSLAPINTAYSQTISTEGGAYPITFALLSGSLPTGLSLNTSTGVISGTPTVGGTYNFTIRITDGDTTTDDQALSINVNTTPTAPTILYTGNLSAQSGESNPTNISNPYFSAVYNDADSGDTATNYQVQVYSDANATSLIWDSGTVALSPNCTEGNRCHDIQFGGSLTNLLVDSTYYWRIRYKDTAGTTSPWSENAPLTNSFKFVSSGTSITVQEARKTPDNPLALAPTIIDATTIKIEWIDRSTNEIGFRVLNEFNEIIKEVDANTTSTIIENLPSNTEISGLKVVAYNSNGQSTPSQNYAVVVLPNPPVKPTLVDETENSITIGINQIINNLNEGQSGIEFEMRQNGVVVSTDWIRKQSYTFIDIDFLTEIEVRVRTKNQEGEIGDWSDWVSVNQLETGGLLLSFDISSIGSTEATALRQFDLESRLRGVVSMSNNTDAIMSNVFLNMVLPNDIDYRNQTLVVDGKLQTDIADDDFGQANSNAISMIIDELDSFTGIRVEFELAFSGRYKEDFLQRRIGNVIQKIQSGELLQTSTEDEKQEIIQKLELRSLTKAVAIGAQDIIELTVTASADNQDAVEITQEISGSEEQADLVILEELQEDSTIFLPVEKEVVNEPPSEKEEQEIIETIENVLEEISNPEPQNQPTSPEVIEIPRDLGETSSVIDVVPGVNNPGTSVSKDNGDFSVQTIGNNGKKLTVTGSAKVLGSQINFSGKASEPFSVVTIILNNNNTVIAVADRVGNWATSITAEQLGLGVGDEEIYDIDLIAAKGDLKTSRVNIGRVTLLLKAIDELNAEFERARDASTLQAVIQNIISDVDNYIKKNERQISSTLAISAPIILISSAPLWGYLPFFPTLLYHVITYLIGFIGRKKKKERFFGIVYDSITKDPLALSIVRIYNSSDKKLVATVVSDKKGRYEVLLKDGNYYLEAHKPQFVFPSHIVQTTVDGQYDQIYQSTGFTFSSTKSLLPDIPLDPINYNLDWVTGNVLKKLWISLQRVGKFLAVPLLLTGSLASIILVAALPQTPINWVLAVLYVIMLFLQLRLRFLQKPAWGTVLDGQTNSLLDLIPIELIDSEHGKIVKSRLTDYDGRYYFSPNPGLYKIKTNKEGYRQEKDIEVKVSKKKERITKDIKIYPQKDI